MAHCPKSFRTRYGKLFELEADKELFEWLLSDPKFDIKVRDVGFLDKRRPDRLISYTTNLNPALCKFLEQIEAIPMTVAMQHARVSVAGNRRRIGDAFNLKMGDAIDVSAHDTCLTSHDAMIELQTLLKKDIGLAAHAPAFARAGVDMGDLLSKDWEYGRTMEKDVAFDLALLVSFAGACRAWDHVHCRVRAKRTARFSADAPHASRRLSWHPPRTG